ncbi:hypothetical protein AgCh_015485 [Apium graveolens]
MEAPPSITSYSDRQRALQAFDDTKAGVKGLVDAGVQKIPDIFVHPPDTFDKNSETFGFFQVVNHGIPMTVLQEMLQGVHRFFEQDTEVKKQFYTRDYTKKVVYNTNYDFFNSPATNWRDSFACFMAPPPQPGEFPEPCRTGCEESALLSSDEDCSEISDYDLVGIFSVCEKFNDVNLISKGSKRVKKNTGKDLQMSRRNNEPRKGRDMDTIPDRTKEKNLTRRS